MEGAALAEKKRFDMAIIAAWHTEAFARTKRLPKLTTLIGESASKQSSAQALAFFQRLKADGIPVTITKNEIN